MIRISRHWQLAIPHWAGACIRIRVPIESAFIGANPMNGESRSIRSWVITSAGKGAATVFAVLHFVAGWFVLLAAIRRAFFPSTLPFPYFGSMRRYCRCARLAVHRFAVNRLAFRWLDFRGFRSATSRDDNACSSDATHNQSKDSSHETSLHIGRASRRYRDHRSPGSSFAAGDSIGTRGGQGCFVPLQFTPNRNGSSTVLRSY